MSRATRRLWRGLALLVGGLGLAATGAAVAAAPGQLAAVRVWAMLATMVVVEALATRAARGRGYTTFTSSTVFACAVLLTDGTAAGMVVFAVGGVLTEGGRGSPALQGREESAGCRTLALD